MKLTFLGTRAEIDARSRHRRHSVLEVTHLRRCVLIDCGRDWRTEIEKLAPHAIVLTHAHPDSCVRPARRGALSGACHARNVGWVDPLAAGVVRGGGRAAGVFTHCGSEIVRGDGRVLNARLRRLACEHSLRAEFAFGGLVVVPGEDD